MSLIGKTEITANVTSTAAALFLGIVLVKSYLLAPARPAIPTIRPGASAIASATPGATLKGKLEGVDWGGNGRTVVLAISTACHFCKESEPFYRRLKQEAGKGVKIVAVLPQPLSEAQQYLNAADVSVDQVKQLSLDTIGVWGTPTVLLVDGKGVITRVWTGKLQSKQEEQQVIAEVRKG
jgi:hypothetical protein